MWKVYWGGGAVVDFFSNLRSWKKKMMTLVKIKDTIMVNFTCQRDVQIAVETLFLGVSVRVFSHEIRM